MKDRIRMVSRIAYAVLPVFFLVACAVQAQASTPPEPTPTVDRLATPPLPENPSQADLGAQVYYQVCMACHGDKGQGLTDEWRAVWGEDADCWQKGCHGNDHPPQGYHLIETCCKAVMGPGTLANYDNGQELFDYIVKKMPWWNPGYLKTEEFWQVTTFLMRAHGAIPDGVSLNAGNAFVFNLRPVSPPPGNKRSEVLVVGALLAGIASLLYFQGRARR
jgi:cytochrome c5